MVFRPWPQCTQYHQTTGYKNWCPGHDHSVLNITKQQAVKIDVQAMTTVHSISPIQQAIQIDVQAMTTVYSISCDSNIMSQDIFIRNMNWLPITSWWVQPKLLVGLCCSSLYLYVFVFVLCVVCLMLVLTPEINSWLPLPFFTLIDVNYLMRNWSHKVFFFLLQNWGNYCYY